MPPSPPAAAAAAACRATQDVVDVMKPCPVTAGTDIITQGDSGDLFYVMCGGIAKVLVGGNHVGTAGIIERECVFVSVRACVRVSE